MPQYFSLYRTAFAGPITRWVARQIGLSIDKSNWLTELSHQRDSRTWYCPVTDSMDISSFYHLNQLQGVSHRPGFRSLLHFKANGGSLVKYMDDAGLDRLVLLEDFVGTGTQTAKTVGWAAEHLDKSVLFVPLVIAPDGVRRLKEVEMKLGADRLQVAPIIELEASEFIGPAGSSNPLFFKIKEIAQRVHSQVRGTAPDHPCRSPYSALGFQRPKDQCTGATVILHSNCPNNSIPIIHHHSSHTQWKPLFPRVEREPNTP
jgi:hypothetical protein